MERRFKEALEFNKIIYRVVKNERLADPYTRQAEAFATAVREGRPAPIDPEEAVANLAVLDEIRAQSRSAAEA